MSNGEWTKAIEFATPKGGELLNDVAKRLVALFSALMTCPKCRALVTESDTLMHELECWK